MTLFAVHRPGVDNELADFLSRNRPDPGEWSLSSRAAKMLFRIWGKPQIDLFATADNCKAPTWYSRRLSPGSSAVDAFSQGWKGWKIYAFPPISQIQRVLIKIRDEGVEDAIVLVPHWPRRPWFSLLLTMAVEQPVRFRIQPDLLTQTLTSKGKLYHPDLGRLSLVTWRLTGATGAGQVSARQSRGQPWLHFVPPPGWCTTRSGESMPWCKRHRVDPISAPLTQVLRFLQAKADKGYGARTLAGYVTSISRRHCMVKCSGKRCRVSKCSTVQAWSRGIAVLNPRPRVIVPGWSLDLVLSALKRPPYFPLKECELKYLTMRTAFLMAVTSARRASELQAICCDTMVWRAHEVIAYTDPEFLPKVHSEWHGITTSQFLFQP